MRYNFLEILITADLNGLIIVQCSAVWLVFTMNHTASLQLPIYATLPRLAMWGSHFAVGFIQFKCGQNNFMNIKYKAKPFNIIIF